MAIIISVYRLSKEKKEKKQRKSKTKKRKKKINQNQKNTTNDSFFNSKTELSSNQRDVF